MTKILIGWIVLQSMIAFAAMGLDKQYAKHHKRRIHEKVLWTYALIGGGIGAYLGMQIFRHKTRHTSFRIGFLMLAILYCAILLYLSGIWSPTIEKI